MKYWRKNSAGIEELRNIRVTGNRMPLANQTLVLLCLHSFRTTLLHNVSEVNNFYWLSIYLEVEVYFTQLNLFNISLPRFILHRLITHKLIYTKFIENNRKPIDVEAQ